MPCAGGDGTGGYRGTRDGRDLTYSYCSRVRALNRSVSGVQCLQKCGSGTREEQDLLVFPEDGVPEPYTTGPKDLGKRGLETCRVKDSESRVGSTGGVFRHRASDG